MKGKNEMHKTKKIISTLLVALLIFLSFPVSASAESYVEQPINEEFQNETGLPQPLYDIIFSVKMYATEEKLAGMVEADNDCSLRITLTLYEENGSGWSFLAKKTFSGYSSALLGELYYDFEPGVTYRGVANFYAGGETDTMDETFSF